VRPTGKKVAPPPCWPRRRTACENYRPTQRGPRPWGQNETVAISSCCSAGCREREDGAQHNVSKLDSFSHDCNGDTSHSCGRSWFARIVRPHRNWLFPWQSPPFAMLNHSASDSGIPRRVTQSEGWYKRLGDGSPCGGNTPKYRGSFRHRGLAGANSGAGLWECTHQRGPERVAGWLAMWWRSRECPPMIWSGVKLVAAGAMSG
jgi:hypothetical protein